MKLADTRVFKLRPVLFGFRFYLFPNFCIWPKGAPVSPDEPLTELVMETKAADGKCFEPNWPKLNMIRN